MAAFLPKLTPEQREEIKVRLATGTETAARIAFDYKVGAVTVNRIRKEMKGVKEDEENGNFDFTDITCEEKEQGYRENLRWAINAAGTYLRTKQHPESCPCNAALYLYRQAILEPKDFISKIGQLENKREDSDKATQKRSARRAIEEINSMLAELEHVEEKNDTNIEVASQ